MNNKIIDRFLIEKDVIGYHSPTVRVYINLHIDNNTTDQIIDLLKPLVWLFMYEKKRYEK